MPRKAVLPFLPALVLTSCGLQFSGASAPSEHTFKLTEADLEEAASVDCDQAWATGNADADIAAGLQILAERKVRVIKKNPFAGGSALAYRLYVTPEWDERPSNWKATLLRHELTHYCDRDRLGDTQFEIRYAHSAGRWVLETRAYAQSVREWSALGASEAQLRGYVDEKVGDLRDQYLLWDIDPAQYEAETTRILLEAVDLRPA